MFERSQRRRFLKQVALAGCVAPFADVLRAEQTKSPPSEKLNLGVIGVAGQGAANLAAVSSENVVALCDVDLARAGEAKTAFPQAAVYQDFRKLIDRNGIDAIIVSTPDHMHAIPSVAAMRAGKHVYCEQPLSRTVHEALTMRDVAHSAKRITQLGVPTNGACDSRKLIEIIREKLGPVKRVELWTAARPVACQRAKEGSAPPTLDYNLWLGPAPFRPYHDSHCHRLWRYWWDFGGGTLAEFGCALFDAAFSALNLRGPSSVAANGTKDHNGDNQVPGNLEVVYEFPARGELPPVVLRWRHGSPPPQEAQNLNTGALFVGEKAQLLTNLANTHRLINDGKAEAVSVEPQGPQDDRRINWLSAVKASRQASCPFEYGAPLSVAVHLGNIAYRAGNKTLHWNAATSTITNDLPQAAALLHPEYRKGWTL